MVQAPRGRRRDRVSRRRRRGSRPRSRRWRWRGRGLGMRRRAEVRVRGTERDEYCGVGATTPSRSGNVGQDRRRRPGIQHQSEDVEANQTAADGGRSRGVRESAR